MQYASEGVHGERKPPGACRRRVGKARNGAPRPTTSHLPLRTRSLRVAPMLSLDKNGARRSAQEKIWLYDSGSRLLLIHLLYPWR
jgi:hypothetical protein